MPPGLFGKLPAHGDFVSRGLPAGLRNTLDHWITHNIGQRTLPRDGLRARLTLGGGPILAVIQQSQDKHGRVFPIVVVVTDGGQDTDAVHQWCDQTAELLQTAIADKLDADTLLTILPAAPQAMDDGTLASDIIWRKGEAAIPLATGLSALSSD